MTGVEAANKLLNEVCSVSPRSLVEEFGSGYIKEFVNTRLATAFEEIIELYPEFAEEVISHTVRYHKNVGITELCYCVDCMFIPEWYLYSLRDHGKDYFNKNDKYYNLRMSEVINMYLIGKQMNK